MRRYLLVFAVIALAFAAACFLAVAQGPSSATASTGQTVGSDAQPQTSLAGIQSAKAVSLVASGLSPRALSISFAGNAYLTNSVAPDRIFSLTSPSGLPVSESTKLTLIAGDGVAGSLGDGGNAFAAQLNVKTDSLFLRSGIAVAPDGTLLVADTRNSTVRRIAGSDSPEPGVIRSIAGRWAAPKSLAIVDPLGLALDRAGDLYLADHSSGAIDLLPGAVTSLPGEQQVQLLAHVAGPASLALTPDGRKLFVASTDTGAVVSIDTQTREIESIRGFPAQNAASEAISKPICRTGASESTGPTSICPAGIAVDGASNLFVADANSGKILRVDAQTSQVTTAASGLHTPGAIAFDNDANLYVAEQGAGRIIKFASMGTDPSNLTITPPAALPAPPAPRVCPQTAPFNFCDQPMGGASPTQAFTLTNNTSAAVSGLAISFSGSNTADFQDASNTCGTSLAAGVSCTINVAFAPTAAGPRSSNLTVTDSAGDSAEVVVSGTGDDFQLVLNGSQQEEAVIQGGTLTYNFSVVPDAVFGGVVTITCPSNLPSFSTCTPSASTVTVTPGTSTSLSITFKTTYDGITGGFPGSGFVPLLKLPAGRTGPPAPMTVPSGLALLIAALALFFILFARYRSSPTENHPFLSARAVSVIALVLALSGFACLAGCKHASVPSDLNTPPGTTTMTVQGSAQNAGRGVTIILDVTGRG